MIVDRFGEPLAQNRWVNALALRLASVADATSGAEALAKLQPQIDALPATLRDRVSFSTSDLEKHWEHRRFIPFPISEASVEIEAKDIATEASVGITVIPEMHRYYPEGKTAAHILGYLSRELPRQFGPMSEEEPLWPVMTGSAGLEKSFEETLAGKPGLVQVVYSESGAQVSQTVIKEPEPGETLVTTLMLNLQKLSEETLGESGRSGAITFVDSISGDVVAMASYPTYDPNAFIPAISSTDYKTLSEDPAAPFFARAWAASYPPGSVFKPFVAIAGLDRGIIRGLATRFEGLPSLEIDGRVFNNWSDKNEGMLDVRGALMRSSNTWFYRAGIMTGGANIVATAREYGIGEPVNLPLDNVSPGSLPSPAPPTNQGVANLSIGQGKVETSSLQMATAMATLANGKYRPSPRLIIQSQTAPIEGEESFATETFARTRENLLSTRPTSFDYVRAGMWLVVNHERGTGKQAAVENPQVRGKTGTAQWSLNGEERNLVWFSGYVDALKPQLAFTVMLEGRSGEKLYGGSGAAPIIGDVLRTAYAAPDEFRLSPPPVRSQSIRTQTLTEAQPAAGGQPRVIVGQSIQGQGPQVTAEPVPRQPTSAEVMNDARRVEAIDPSAMLRQLETETVPRTPPVRPEPNKRGLLKRIGGLFD